MRWIRSVIALAWIASLVVGMPSLAVARVRAGVELGVNYSSLDYDDLGRPPMSLWDPGWRASFTGGATLQFPLRGRFDLVTGLRYVQQGNRVKVDEAEAPPLHAEFRIYQDYVSVPALLTYYPSTKQRFFLSLGPEVGFLVAARSIIHYSSPPFPDASTDEKDGMEGINVTLDAAAGYEFPAGDHVAITSLRYTHGVTGVAKEDHWVTDWQTRGVEFLVGMRW